MHELFVHVFLCVEQNRTIVTLGFIDFHTYRDYIDIRNESAYSNTCNFGGKDYK